MKIKSICLILIILVSSCSKKSSIEQKEIETTFAKDEASQISKIEQMTESKYLDQDLLIMAKFTDLTDYEFNKKYHIAGIESRILVHGQVSNIDQKGETFSIEVGSKIITPMTKIIIETKSESIISKILDLTKKDTKFYFVFKGLVTSRKDIVEDGNQVSQRVLNGELLEVLDKDGACIDGNCVADEISTLCAGIDCKEHDFRLIQQQKDKLLKENNELVERKLNELKEKKQNK